MNDIEWSDPPKQRGGHQRRELPWADWASMLRASPGKWAMLCGWEHQGATASQANRINRGGNPPFFPDGTFEAVCRRRTPSAHYKKWGLWVRYVGENQELA